MAEGDLQRTVGRNLRAHRLELGLSQEAFADRLGVHRTYMGGLERGERNLTLKSLERIASRLQLEPLSLMAEGTAVTAETPCWPAPSPEREGAPRPAQRGTEVGPASHRREPTDP